MFSSLDWILDQASQRGIHLILPIEVQLSTLFLTFPAIRTDSLYIACISGSHTRCGLLNRGTNPKLRVQPQEVISEPHTNTWIYVGELCAQDYWLSLDRYVNWSSTAKSTNDFYTDWNCRQMYKDHIEHYVNRRNTYNGRLYKEDPTIFYWDLINEPRW